jgi:hypothetical protein
MDTFFNMAKMGIYVVDRVVQEKLGGGIDLEKDLWYIPDVGIHIIEGSMVEGRSIEKG